MIPQLNFDSAAAVSDFVQSKYHGLYPGPESEFLVRVFRDTGELFAGRRPPYAACDLRYHNLRHTLMATACMALLLEGRHGAAGGEVLHKRDFELGIAGILLHDAGYLKLEGDEGGTGAKYTYCHILRSCAYAASYLPTIGADDFEIENVMSAIDCTGPNSQIGRMVFSNPVSRFIGCALATADYLGQLADPDYPEKLGDLFLEFQESDSFVNVPPARRQFKSEEDLVCRTPGFWRQFVKPRLENDYQGAYRYLSKPVLTGGNDYLAAIEANFVRIEARAAAIRSSSSV